MCQVINFRQYGSVPALDEAFGKSWQYIGRANHHYHLPQSPLANPFKVKAFGKLSRTDFGGRGKTLGHYRRWLWGRIQASDEGVMAALAAIGDDTALVCWCKPGPCHGDVVQAAAEWLRTVNSQQTTNNK